MVESVWATGAASSANRSSTISFSLVFVWAYVEQADIYTKTNVNTILVIKVFCDMLEDHGKE